MPHDGEMWLVHGHVHGAWRQNGRQINVGVDQWDFKLVSHEKILEMIKDGPKFEGKSKDDYGD
jgi:calcineurin-like phosphoesterase family protein